MADKLLEIKGVSKIFRVGGMIVAKSLLRLTTLRFPSTTISRSSSPSLANPVAASPHCVRWFCVCTTRIWATSCWTANLTAIRKSYDAKQFKLEVQPIFQNPYESFSARKPVDSYLFNTALRLGIAKNKAEATNLVDDALKSVGLSLAVVKGKYPTSSPAASCSVFPLHVRLSPVRS